MWSGFQAKKLNTRWYHELELAVNQAEPENQAGLVPGPDPDQIKNFEIFSQKIKSATMPVHHVKGQPGTSMYVREKGRFTFHTNRETPCSIFVLSNTVQRVSILLRNSSVAPVTGLRTRALIKNAGPIKRGGHYTVFSVHKNKVRT